MFGEIIASKYQLTPLEPERPGIPWPERLLSAEIQFPNSHFFFHATHIPPGSSNGWMKIDMITGVTDYLLASPEQTHILCGDFNTPKAEILE
jgi:endonuclease/exonuclease/phosphatase family metal-dependent hydrolase